MNIHVFNPEHDLSLAHNGERFTPPHAARQLRMNLGFLPALWADNGDVVLVDDVAFANQATIGSGLPLADVRYMTVSDLRAFGLTDGISGISVWGWDRAIRFQLMQAGVPDNLMPDDSQIETIRQLSHRATAVNLLTRLRSHPRLAPLTVGESRVCTTMDAVEQTIGEWGRVVLKSPWSSSGRGIKYVDSQLSRSQQGWCDNVLRSQGCVVVEIYNNKVKDFAMEFFSDGQGHVSYAGLSLFSTLNGAYTGNIVAPEADKEAMLAAFLPIQVLHEVQRQLQLLLAEAIGTEYCGPLGVDMMVVASDDGRQHLLNPCVEINLRRTMGHVALSLSHSQHAAQRLMQIVHTGNYELRLLEP